MQAKTVLNTAIAAAVMTLSPLSSAAVIELTIDGSDAIWLAGRTDISIPAANLGWPDGLIRHGSPTPEENLETLPPGFAVAGGDVIKVLDPVSGGINFFNGLGPPYFGPEGNGNPDSSIISSFGGISGYRGTQGALVGVFLDDNIPNGVAPATLDFSNAGLGLDFLSVAPSLGQIFFIGNGMTTGGIFQEFIAPTGAKRLFVGIPDAFSFNGPPGAYDDNDGSYVIRVGINEDPRNPTTPTSVPEPGAMLLLLSALGLLKVNRR